MKYGRKVPSFDIIGTKKLRINFFSNWLRKLNYNSRLLDSYAAQLGVEGVQTPFLIREVYLEDQQNQTPPDGASDKMSPPPEADTLFFFIDCTDVYDLPLIQLQKCYSYVQSNKDICDVPFIIILNCIKEEEVVFHAEYIEQWGGSLSLNLNIMGFRDYSARDDMQKIIQKALTVAKLYHLYRYKHDSLKQFFVKKSATLSSLFASFTHLKLVITQAQIENAASINDVQVEGLIKRDANYTLAKGDIVFIHEWKSGSVNPMPEGASDKMSPPPNNGPQHKTTPKVLQSSDNDTLPEGASDKMSPPPNNGPQLKSSQDGVLGPNSRYKVKVQDGNIVYYRDGIAVSYFRILRYIKKPNQKIPGIIFLNGTKFYSKEQYDDYVRWCCAVCNAAMHTNLQYTEIRALADHKCGFNTKGMPLTDNHDESDTPCDAAQPSKIKRSDEVGESSDTSFKIIFDSQLQSNTGARDKMSAPPGTACESPKKEEPSFVEEFDLTPRTRRYNLAFKFRSENTDKKATTTKSRRSLSLNDSLDKLEREIERKDRRNKLHIKGHYIG